MKLSSMFYVFVLFLFPLTLLYQACCEDDDEPKVIVCISPECLSVEMIDNGNHMITITWSNVEEADSFIVNYVEKNESGEPINPPINTTVVDTFITITFGTFEQSDLPVYIEIDVQSKCIDAVSEPTTLKFIYFNGVAVDIDLLRFLILGTPDNPTQNQDCMCNSLSSESLCQEIRLLGPGEQFVGSLEILNCFLPFTFSRQELCVCLNSSENDLIQCIKDHNSKKYRDKEIIDTAVPECSSCM